MIQDGHFGAVDLRGLRVALAGRYDNREPGKPWRVILYVDDQARPEQFTVLTNIFLGRAGGTGKPKLSAARGVST